MDEQKFAKIVNDTIVDLISKNPEIIEDIADELIDIMDDNERTFTDKEFNEYNEHVLRLVHKIVTISVSASYVLPSNVKLAELEEENKRLKSKLENKGSHLSVLENPDSSESAEDPENQTPES